VDGWRDDEGESTPPREPTGSADGPDPAPRARGETPKAAAFPPNGHQGKGQAPANAPRGGPRQPSTDRQHPETEHEATLYGALDLGTNNCRLLIARPTRRSFRVVDAFSRIIRLGEGVSLSGRLSDAAMTRTVEALKVCAGKLARGNVQRARLVATEACRIAANGPDFLDRVQRDVGLELEILTRESEAKLAVAGCASLIDNACDYVLVFDIGGGSSELIWLDLTDRHDGYGGAERIAVQNRIAAWTSLPVGVVTLAERFGGRNVTMEGFEAMVAYVMDLAMPFEAEHGFRLRTAGHPIHMLGTSGTVTTVAGIQLKLERYDRSRVDGCWLDMAGARRTTYDLIGRTYEERVAEPCIGRDRADLVLAGCAILEALLRLWPCERLRVADRGLREGILMTLMSEDGAYRYGRGRGRGPQR